MLTDATLHDRAQELRARFTDELLAIDAKLPEPTSDAGVTAGRLVAGELRDFIDPGSELAAALNPSTPTR